MLGSRISLIVISVSGILFNSLSLYITGRYLHFDGTDIILMGFIAMFDMLLCLTNISRIVALESKWLIISQNTNIWCIFDSSSVLTLSQITTETVAVLGVLRYLAICYNKHFRPLFWFSLISFLFIASLALSLGNSLFPNTYEWSVSRLFCFPNSEPDFSNHSYFIIWGIITGIRLSISLIVITFCYYKILMNYHKVLGKFDSIELNVSDKIQSSTDLTYSNIRNRFQRQRKIISIQLLGIALLYILCITPINYTLIHEIIYDNPLSIDFITVSQLLYVSLAIINPLFVLIAHEPSRRELIKILAKAFSFGSTNESLENFPNA